MDAYRSLADVVKKIEENDDVENLILEVEPDFIDPTCVKCGSEEATLEYKGNNVVVQKTLEGGINIIKHGVLKEDEVLIVTCTRCGYQWTDTPLDCKEVVEHTNLDDPNRHNVAGHMNKPAGAEGYRSR